MNLVGDKMEEYIYIGKIVNTHGIKGEIRILSSFEKKDKVFIIGMPIYIGRKKEREVIKSYRHHKNFDMVTLENYSDINEVLKYKGLFVYIKKEDLKLDDGEYLDTDLIGLDVLVDGIKKGVITDIRDSFHNKFLVIKTTDKDVFIPYQKEFIKSVDFLNREVIITPIKGMFE
jgi:16S rRNA processing protein RimM